eukprot:TRINITY_DN9775_c0_g2_i1.p1 TRINITY_DN9775_c0_g2~~TRINITY_DN9775_c0_g2_i1.p1  ORF type:complete len:1014 (+),score=235.75 TRINITY_DN9775_c0_g2_i1:1425-4466(+)
MPLPERGFASPPTPIAEALPAARGEHAAARPMEPPRPVSPMAGRRAARPRAAAEVVGLPRAAECVTVGMDFVGAGGTLRTFKPTALDAPVTVTASRTRLGVGATSSLSIQMEDTAAPRAPLPEGTSSMSVPADASFEEAAAAVPSRSASSGSTASLPSTLWADVPATAAVCSSDAARPPLALPSTASAASWDHHRIPPTHPTPGQHGSAAQNPSPSRRPSSAARPLGDAVTPMLMCVESVEPFITPVAVAGAAPSCAFISPRAQAAAKPASSRADAPHGYGTSDASAVESSGTADPMSCSASVDVCTDARQLSIASSSASAPPFVTVPSASPLTTAASPEAFGMCLYGPEAGCTPASAFASSAGRRSWRAPSSAAAAPDVEVPVSGSGAAPLPNVEAVDVRDAGLSDDEAVTSFTETQSPIGSLPESPRQQEPPPPIEEGAADVPRPAEDAMMWSVRSQAPAAKFGAVEQYSGAHASSPSTPEAAQDQPAPAPAPAEEEEVVPLLQRKPVASSSQAPAQPVSPRRAVQQALPPLSSAAGAHVTPSARTPAPAAAPDSEMWGMSLLDGTGGTPGPGAGAGDLTRELAAELQGLQGSVLTPTTPTTPLNVSRVLHIGARIETIVKEKDDEIVRLMQRVESLEEELRARSVDGRAPEARRAREVFETSAATDASPTSVSAEGPAGAPHVMFDPVATVATVQRTQLSSAATDSPTETTHSRALGKRSPSTSAATDASPTSGVDALVKSGGPPRTHTLSDSETTTHASDPKVTPEERAALLSLLGAAGAAMPLRDCRAVAGLALGHLVDADDVEVPLSETERDALVKITRREGVVPADSCRSALKKTAPKEDEKEKAALLSMLEKVAAAASREGSEAADPVVELRDPMLVFDAALVQSVLQQASQLSRSFPAPCPPPPSVQEVRAVEAQVVSLQDLTDQVEALVEENAKLAIKCLDGFIQQPGGVAAPPSAASAALMSATYANAKFGALCRRLLATGVQQQRRVCQLLLLLDMRGAVG